MSGHLKLSKMRRRYVVISIHVGLLLFAYVRNVARHECRKLLNSEQVGKGIWY